jgi:hypothetical protein
MPECSFHPGVETEVSCTECGRYICPKDMRETPVGYKCPICAEPARSQYVLVKPQQLVRTIALGGATGVLGGLLVSVVPFFGFFAGVLWGIATAEACRRASGGHREWAVGIVAIVAIVAGWLLAPIALHRGAGLLTAAIAVVAALVDLALLEFR